MISRFENPRPKLSSPKALKCFVIVSASLVDDA